MSYTTQLIDFISKCPSVYHRADAISKELEQNGFTRLYENEKWSLEKGRGYFTVRNSSSVIAFFVPENLTGFNIVASHLDSPTFKIKENPEMKGAYVTLNTEQYGGMIMSTWTDRPLSVAGRILTEENGKIVQKLVDIDRDLLIIPNVAIHMDRSVNDGKKFNAQTDMPPLMAMADGELSLADIVAERTNTDKNAVIGSDLFLYNRQKGTIVGANGEFVSSPKLDDLQCVFASLKGFIESEKQGACPVLAVFDNEEVGSGTKQGAASTFLEDVLYRIAVGRGLDREGYVRALSQSMMISADNAHAVHPNRQSYADPTNRPVINGGLVIKYNARQKYTSDGVSAALLKAVMKKVGATWQTFHNRSDLAGGSTLGNISDTKVSVNTVDVGLPQLAMHSAYETAGVKDTEDFVKICRRFFGTRIVKDGDDTYILE